MWSSLKGIPRNVVQQALGHASLAVTTVYLAHLDARQLAEAMEEV